MFDPDPSPPVLRLAAPDAEPTAAPSYDDQVFEALKLYCRAMIDLRAAVMQSQPISAQRVATGPHPIVFRSSGHVERLEAAARGEIGDPAEDLRRERLVMALNGFEPLDAPL